MNPLVLARRSAIAALVLLAAPAIGACGAGEGSGQVQVFVVPEDTITRGIEAGSDADNIRDGWSVSYTRFLIALGDVRAARSDTGDKVHDDHVFVLDLHGAPAQGYVIASFDDLAAVRWDRFGFDVSIPRAGAAPLAPTRPDDAAFMIDHGYAIYFEGSIRKNGGKSCPPRMPCRDADAISFRWGLPAGTAFDDCTTVDGITGFAVPSGGAIQVKPTIHGDHWFFSNFTGGVELTSRRAQYVADCDLDGDGETTLDELRAVAAADVFPVPDYNLSGSIGGPIDSPYDYVMGEARTVGHFQGDGECPTRKVLP